MTFLKNHPCISGDSIIAQIACQVLNATYG
jgi:hypothetical protein